MFKNKKCKLLKIEKIQTTVPFRKQRSIGTFTVHWQNILCP